MTPGAGDMGGIIAEARALLGRALQTLAGVETEAAAGARVAAERATSEAWNVLISGLRSTGKSSLVCALWGDAELLPTAVRDCTQTNTLVRRPNEGEAERRIILDFLPRGQAAEFATRGLAYHRLEEVLATVLGPTGPDLRALPPEARVRKAAETVRAMFLTREDVHILHEPATEQLEQLEQFLEYLDFTEYLPGGRVEKPWSERREYLMGRRREDGRTLDTGKLLSLRLVELVRDTGRWSGPAPGIVDSPWIPAFHNARRAEMALAEADNADCLVLMALPERYELEPWVRDVLARRPELRARTVVVFNQIDTIDLPALQSRGGFAEIWRDNAEALARLGIDSGNLFAACTRLPFLEDLPDGARKGGFEAEREARLRRVLERLRREAASVGDAALRERLLSASDPADAGVESVRRRLEKFARGPVRAWRTAEALKAVAGIDPLEVGAERAKAVAEIVRESGKMALRLAEFAGGRESGPTLPDGRPLFR